MNLKPRTTIIRNHSLARSFALILLLAAFAFAHGGFDHVMGTVVKVEGNILTVKTLKGNVDVKLDEKTDLMKADQKAQVGDLTPGVRVVVDVPEGSKDKIAHSVKIGAATPATDHGAHK
jgi:hypothetical protein